MTKLTQLGITLLCTIPFAVSADVIALYDFQAGGSGDALAGQPGLSSVDTEPNSVATVLTSSSLDGGGAGNIFNGVQTGSTSGQPLTNWGNGHLAEGSANFAQFTTTPSPGIEITYDSLSLFHGAFNLTPKFKITYAIGGGADIVALGTTAHTANNAAALTFKQEDFADFTTNETVIWKIHVFDADAANTGSRFDDITINGIVAVPEPASAALFGLAGVALALLRRRA